MKCHSLILLFSAGLCGQSPYQSGPLGLPVDGTDAATLGLGHSGLLPSHSANVSFANPATWPDLQFAHLAGSYVARESVYDRVGFRGSQGFLGGASFVVPIRDKMAFGLSLKPLGLRAAEFVDDSLATFVFMDDTLLLSKTHRVSGGLSSFSGGFGTRVGENTAVGVSAEFLFGTTREWVTAAVYATSPQVVYSRRGRYTGAVVGATVRHLWGREFPRAESYLSFSWPLDSRRLITTEFRPFLDSNGDGEPQPSEPPVIPSSDRSTISGRERFPWPASVSVGVAYRWAPRWALMAEVNYQVLHGKNSSGVAPQSSFQNFHFLNVTVRDEDAKAGISLLREGKWDSRFFLDRLHLRAGLIYRRPYWLAGRDRSEAGAAFGLGLPFGATHNQFDVGVQIVRRPGFQDLGTELNRSIAVGLTLGDLWLVKRRGK